jgi:hypothetical protein
MTRNTLNALCLSLLSLLAIACGDAGGAPVEEDTDLGGVLAGEEGGNDDDANIEEGDNDIDGNIEEDADDEQDVDGENADDEEEQPSVFEAEGELSVDVVIDSLISNEAPLEDSCSGAIELEINSGAVVGEGRCLLDTNANFLDYVLDADIDDSGVVSGEIDVILNGRSNVLDIEGSFDDGVLSLEFDGVTLVTQNIRAVWNGAIDADFN